MRQSHGLRAAAGAVSATAWDLSYAEYNGTPLNIFYGQAQDAVGTGLFIKPDGTKMYITGLQGQDVNEYNLTVDWDISSATFVQSFAVSTQDNSPQGLFFKPEGDRMYVIGGTGQEVNEYSLSTAWSVSSATFVRVLSVAAQETAPRGLFFRSDGLKMYVLGISGDAVDEYNLSTAWNISTASFLQTFSVATQETNPQGLFFKSDGTAMYVAGSAGNDINEYTLATPWSVSSASFLRLFSVVVGGLSAGEPAGISFNSDGTKLYNLSGNQNRITEHQLSTGWDISTASFVAPTTNYFSARTQDISSTGIFLKPDGTQMYITASSGQEINEYSLSTSWNITSASFVRRLSVSAQETTVEDLFFKPDGTKLYITGSISDNVTEYNLSTPWNISTAVFSQSKSVASEEPFPTGLFFKSDGTKMYITGANTNRVDEYNLSTAWNISTAVAFQSFSLTGQTAASMSIFIKPDGKKMYIAEQTNERILEYNLSTAWSVSSASFVQFFSVAGQGVDVTGLFFKPNGVKMYTTDRFGILWSYDL